MFRIFRRKRKRGARASERGMALIWATSGVLVVAGIVMSGTDEMLAVDRVTKVDFTGDAMANEIGRAGLVDTFAWFRRQPKQPVETFAPMHTVTANVAVNETDDSSVGLVRTFEVSPSIWARYESRHGVPAEAYSDANSNGLFDLAEDFVDTDGDGSWTPARWTRDVSAERGLSGKGIVWHLVARAQIFRRCRADLPVGVGENVQIGSSFLATEIRRLTLTPPATSALCVARGSDVNLGSNSSLRSAESATALAFGENTGTPSTGGAEVDGLSVAMPEYESDLDDVFGVNWTELRSMADISTSDAASGLPVPIPDYSLVVVSGDATFNLERPLCGTGVVVINGNCTIESGSDSSFNGVLFVQGDLTMRAPAYIRGTVIVNGLADVRGGSGGSCEIEHDPGLLSRTLVRMGQYRISKAPYEVSPYLADGRPSELNTAKRRQGGKDYAPGLSKKGEKAAGTADVIPGFSTGKLMDALDKYIAENEGGPTIDQMIAANDKLTLAETLMAQDPPNTSEALAAVRDAMHDLAEAVENGAAVASLANELYSGQGSLFPAMRTMVSELINASDASPESIAAATAMHSDGSELMDRGRARMTAGNEAGAMEDYESAASAFREAVDQL